MALWTSKRKNELDGLPVACCSPERTAKPSVHTCWLLISEAIFGISERGFSSWCLGIIANQSHFGRTALQWRLECHRSPVYRRFGMVLLLLQSFFNKCSLVWPFSAILYHSSFRWAWTFAKRPSLMAFVKCAYSGVSRCLWRRHLHLVHLSLSRWILELN